MDFSVYLYVLCMSTLPVSSTDNAHHHVLHRLGTMISKTEDVYLVTDNSRSVIELDVPIPAVDWSKISSCKNHSNEEILPLKLEEKKYFEKIMAELNLQEPDQSNGTADHGVIDICTEKNAECILKPLQVIAPDKLSMNYR